MQELWTKGKNMLYLRDASNGAWQHVSKRTEKLCDGEVSQPGGGRTCGELVGEGKRLLLRHDSDLRGCVRDFRETTVAGGRNCVARREKRCRCSRGGRFYAGSILALRCRGYPPPQSAARSPRTPLGLRFAPAPHKNAHGPRGPQRTVGRYKPMRSPIQVLPRTDLWPRCMRQARVHFGLIRGETTEAQVGSNRQANPLCQSR